MTCACLPTFLNDKFLGHKWRFEKLVCPKVCCMLCCLVGRVVLAQKLWHPGYLASQQSSRVRSKLLHHLLLKKGYSQVQKRVIHKLWKRGIHRLHPRHSKRSFLTNVSTHEFSTSIFKNCWSRLKKTLVRKRGLGHSLQILLMIKVSFIFK